MLSSTIYTKLNMKILEVFQKYKHCTKDKFSLQQYDDFTFNGININYYANIINGLHAPKLRCNDINKGVLNIGLKYIYYRTCCTYHNFILLNFIVRYYHERTIISYSNHHWLT